MFRAVLCLTVPILAIVHAFPSDLADMVSKKDDHDHDVLVEHFEGKIETVKGGLYVVMMMSNFI